MLKKKTLNCEQGLRSGQSVLKCGGNVVEQSYLGKDHPKGIVSMGGLDYLLEGWMADPVTGYAISIVVLDEVTDCFEAGRQLHGREKQAVAAS
jgi:hypothetical protein